MRARMEIAGRPGQDLDPAPATSGPIRPIYARYDGHGAFDVEWLANSDRDIYIGRPVVLSHSGRTIEGEVDSYRVSREYVIVDGLVSQEPQPTGRYWLHARVRHFAGKG